jgi:Type II CAAX prenyl endopeptidase Rce1-like
MKKLFNWKIFFILLAASIFGVVAVIPYSLALQGITLDQSNLPMPLWMLIPLQVIQNGVMFAIAIGIGLWAANRTGLGLPILEAKLAGEPVSERIKPLLLPSIVLGIIASVLIIALDLYVFSPALKAQIGGQAASLTQPNARPVAWKGLLASFYGGIDEEILLRLGLLSLFAWLGKFVNKTADGHPTLAILWTANILAAVLFGLGHLPATSLLVPLTPLVILRAIVLNGLAGVVFGYLYFSHGLETAMLSHFTADIVLHVLLVL